MSRAEPSGLHGSRAGVDAGAGSSTSSVAPPPPRRTFAEARAAVNRRRQDLEASFEVRGGSVFAHLLGSPRYKSMTAAGESLQLSLSRRFHELSRVLLHEAKYAVVDPADRPHPWPFTIRSSPTSRKAVYEPPRGVLLAGGAVATSAAIRVATAAAAAAAINDASADKVPMLKPSVVTAGKGGQPLDVLAVALHCDAVSALRVLRQVNHDNEAYIAVLNAELVYFCAKGGEQLRRAPEVNTKAEWDEMIMDVLQQGDSRGPYLSQDAAKVTGALEDLATYCLKWVEAEDFAPPRPFNKMHELYSPPLQKIVELCWQLRNADNQDRPKRERAVRRVVRRGKSRAFYAAHFGAKSTAAAEGEGEEEDEEEEWSDGELSLDGEGSEYDEGEGESDGEGGAGAEGAGE
mmetsp:Transcript_30221/g.77016  ORF Transcript_30221/g.77016 Transcript_30221/m.77016 type:complete len:404 (+) Transcript_30221:82-1293(+)